MRTSPALSRPRTVQRCRSRLASKALAIPPYAYSTPCAARFTARMAVAAGATTVKFSTLSYHALTGYPVTMPFSYIFTVAIPNGNLLQHLR
jgi:hypothetical protein